MAQGRAVTRYWLVRHGPTHASTMVGWTDLPADLSDRAAVARLSSHLPDAPVISSDLVRARQTADALRGGRPRLADDPGLREIHFGDWEGAEFQSVYDKDRERVTEFWNNPGAIAAPNGESWDMLAARVTAALDRLAGPPDIIVVAHFGAILTQVQRAEGWTSREAFSRRVRNLSVTDLTRTEDGLVLGAFNQLV